MPPSISLFFFSNDPPTPDIYTLSLHDALPILDHQGPVEALLLLVVGCGCEVRLQPRGAVRAEPVGVDVSDVELPQSEDQDRKSTRLNSSHANISYAVFCLKKKKKKSNT